MQVAPAEIENHLVLHPAISDVAVIGVEDEFSGERAKAFIVRSREVMTEMGDSELKLSINKHVESHFNESYWLQGRIVFTDEIPRSQSGKVLKRVLRSFPIQQ